MKKQTLTLHSLAGKDAGYEEFGSKTVYIHFCVFEKNAVLVWNLLGNALAKF
jgi:hypothetical protein